MRSHAPFKPIVTKFCMLGRVCDMITDAKFYGNRLRGFGVTGPSPKCHFLCLGPGSVEMLRPNVHRPYNSVSTTVLHCDTEASDHVKAVARIFVRGGFDLPLRSPDPFFPHTLSSPSPFP